ncbi:YceI family protein [Isoptericola sp. NEAU-Y5]|uniref:YceI family protein n=1 Tax=Isoptericola luteus TaxID=2879484 RepID=A0ABS7ZIY0_9MICO|nr:YceI family protein [Isoptericola sp. NEAU-Y5]
MRGRTKVMIGAGAALVLLGGAAVIVGPGLYADWANDAAAQAPALEASAAPLGDTAALDGEWAVAPGSVAGYRVHEVLRGEEVTVTGRTEDVTGGVTVEGGRITAAEVTVDVESIATDEPPRDAYFRGNVMEVGTYPTATFAVTEPVPLTEGATDVDLPGELTVHGVTHDVVVPARVAADGDGVQVVGSVPVTFADYDVSAPSLGFVRVDEEGAVEFSLLLERAP